MVDPEFEINRQIKVLTSKRKKTDEDNAQIARLEWYGGLYAEPFGPKGEMIVVEPTAKVRKCLVGAARISKLGKSLERALSFSSLYVPLEHDGPADIDELFATPRFRSRLSVGVGQKRVMRVRPQFYPWALTLEGVFIEDAGINWDEFVRILDLAGVCEGIGDNRVNGYGRFTGAVEQIKARVAA
jgi:hypothetical protein